MRLKKPELVGMKLAFHPLELGSIRVPNHGVMVPRTREMMFDKKKSNKKKKGRCREFQWRKNKILAKCLALKYFFSYNSNFYLPAY